MSNATTNSVAQLFICSAQSSIKFETSSIKTMSIRHKARNLAKKIVRAHLRPYGQVTINGGGFSMDDDLNDNAL